MHVPTCPAIVFILQAQSLYQMPWSLSLAQRLCCSQTTLHFSEHRSLSSLQSAGRKSCSFHSADLSELALLQVFHSFPRVSMAPVCWGILKYCPQYIQSCFLIIVLLLLTMFLLFIYHLTALNQSEWHSDDDAFDLTRELMSHSWLAYSLRSSMQRRWLTFAPFCCLYLEPVLRMIWLRGFRSW